jgi:hypothetical protein
MCAAYRADMTISEVLGRPSTMRADHATLLRHDSSERTRTLAFWASFDANPLSRQRWADSCAASWQVPAVEHRIGIRETTAP